MATHTFDPMTDGPTPEQESAAAQALEQGEQLIQAQEQDRQRRFEENQASNEDVELIDGKFKSQEDLLKAYKELEGKLGRDTPEEGEEPTEEQPDTSDETEEEEAPEVKETIDYMRKLSEVFDEHGSLNDEDMNTLAEMDSRDLINAYLKYYQGNQQQALGQQAVQDIYSTVGGQESYTEMMTWASTNLPEADINSFNEVANSNNATALKFAVEALYARYRGAEGFEAPLVTGRKATAPNQSYRSNAELARDLADPRYHADPAFRADVEQKLARSGDLL